MTSATSSMPLSIFSSMLPLMPSATLSTTSLSTPTRTSTSTSNTPTTSSIALTIVYGCEPCSGDLDAAHVTEGAEPAVELLRVPLTRGRLSGEPTCAGHEVTSLLFAGERVGVPVTWLRKIRDERFGDPPTLDLLAAAVRTMDALGDRLGWPE